jgi:hypothetical protein
MRANCARLRDGVVFFFVWSRKPSTLDWNEQKPKESLTGKVWR